MSRPHTLIGLTGYAQHGKDTVGEYLVKRNGYKRYSFADGVRAAVLKLDPMILNLEPVVFDNDTIQVGDSLRGLVTKVGWDEAKLHPEVRRLLQVMGTEVGRDMFGPDVWVNIVADQLRSDNVVSEDASGFWFPQEGGRAVITDVRFPNEAALIKRLGGELWRVERYNTRGPGHEGERAPYDNGLGTEHPSEAYIGSLTVDRIIDNVGTIADLEGAVLTALTSAPDECPCHRGESNPNVWCSHC